MVGIGHQAPLAGPFLRQMAGVKDEGRPLICADRHMQRDPGAGEMPRRAFAPRLFRINLQFLVGGQRHQQFQLSER